MKCMYIYNPKSGKQKNTTLVEFIVRELKNKYTTVDVLETQKKGDAGNFAYSACGNYDTIVVSGGDGTINEVINKISEADNRPKIGIIPTGTVNDLAHSLKIPKNPKKALSIIINAKTTTHDVFRVNDKYGIYICGFGTFTAVSYLAKKSTKKKFGKLAYYMSGINELKRAKSFEVSLKTNNIEIESNIVLGLIVNNKYVGGYKINKKASHNDGFVNVILFKQKKKKGLSFVSVFNLIRLFLFGITTLKTSKNCVILKLNKFDLSLPQNKIVNIDGERASKGSFSFEVLPRHVEIFVK